MNRLNIELAKDLLSDIRVCLDTLQLKTKNTIRCELQDIERKAYSLTKTLEIFDTADRIKKIEERLQHLENIKNYLDNNNFSNKRSS